MFRKSSGPAEPVLPMAFSSVFHVASSSLPSSTGGIFGRLELMAMLPPNMFLAMVSRLGPQHEQQHTLVLFSTMFAKLSPAWGATA